VPRTPWYRDGDEPDYRFTLANERTFLAWLRTGLALLAGAVALTQLAPALGDARWRAGVAVLLAATGTVLAASAYRRWARVQRAMRRGEPLPMTRLPFAVGYSVAAVGAVVTALIVSW
jgi:putative membrane protein